MLTYLEALKEVGLDTDSPLRPYLASVASNIDAEREFLVSSARAAAATIRRFSEHVDAGRIPDNVPGLQDAAALAKMHAQLHTRVQEFFALVRAARGPEVARALAALVQEPA